MLDLLFGLVALFIAGSLQEVMEDVETKNKSSREQLCEVVKESWTFLRYNKRARKIMITNALVGGIDAGIIFPAGEASSCGT